MQASHYFANLDSMGSRLQMCVQEPGDLVLAPNWWGHATYNLNTSVGVAFEVEYSPRLYDPGKAQMEAAFTDRYPQFYAGWEIPPQTHRMDKFMEMLKSKEDKLLQQHRSRTSAHLYTGVGKAATKV